MQIELNRAEAETLRDLLHNEVDELDKEINRTDSLRFKHELQQTDRTIEAILERVVAALGSAAESVP